MSLFNLGGPGWFSDVFTVELELSSERVIETHSMLFHEKCKLLSTQENMFGTVKLIPPPNCSVWHGGVSIGLDTSLSFFESLTTTETKDLEVVIEEAGYISEEKIISFEIPLSEYPKISESYDGEMFCIRHLLSVTIKRPWYTFDVISSLPLIIHKIESDPLAEQSSQNDDDPSSTNQGGMNLLRVADMPQGVSLSYEKSCLAIGDSFTGTIRLGDKLAENQTPIEIMASQLLVYKIESGESDANEVVIIVKNVDIESKTLQNVPATTEGTSEVGSQNSDQVKPDVSFVLEGDVIEIPISLEMKSTEGSIELGATVIDPIYSVRYYVRLVVTDKNNASYWNTHELVLYRSTVGVETI